MQSYRHCELWSGVSGHAKGFGLFSCRTAGRQRSCDSSPESTAFIDRTAMPSHDYDKERLLNNQDTDSEIDTFARNTRSEKRIWQERPSTSWKPLAILVLTIVISNICTGLFVVSRLKGGSSTGSSTAILPKTSKAHTKEQDPDTIRTLSRLNDISFLLIVNRSSGR